MVARSWTVADGIAERVGEVVSWEPRARRWCTGTSTWSPPKGWHPEATRRRPGRHPQSDVVL